MWPVISFLGLTVPVGPLFALLSFYIGSDLGMRSLGRVAPPEERTAWQTAFTNATFAAIIAGLIGARLGYAARYFPIYLDAPQLLLSIRPGALALLPGLIAGGALGLLYLARKNVPTMPTSDAAAIGITSALAVLSLGRFLTGEGYGAPTAMPWAIDLWGAARHPVQLYELCFLLVALGLLWRHQRRVLPGELFWRAVAYVSLVELGVAAFRADAQTWLFGVRMTQVIALVVLLAALYVLSFYARQRTDAVHVGAFETMQPAKGDQTA